MMALMMGSCAASVLDNQQMFSWRRTSSNRAFAAAYGDGIFVTVSDTTIYSSSDGGESWTSRTMPASYIWVDVTYGNGVFVAVSANYSGTGAVMTSPNGTTWTLQTIDNRDWKCISFGAGLFVALGGNSGSTYISTSPDGVTWTNRTPSASFLVYGGASIAFGGGVFVALANGTRVSTSPDGINWSDSTILNRFWREVTYGDSKFVAVSSTTTDDTKSAVSSDGTSWTIGTPPDINLLAVSNNNSAFVAVSSNGEVVESIDGLLWSQAFDLPSLTSNIVYDICYGNGTFVIVGDSDIWVSP